MAWTFVQQNVIQASASLTGSVAYTTQNNAINNVLVFLCLANGQSNFSNMQDSGGVNSWIPLGSYYDATAAYTFGAWAVYNQSGGTKLTCSVTSNISVAWNLAVYEFSGSTGVMQDGTVTGTHKSGGGACQVPSFTASGGSLWFNCIQASSTASWNSPWTGTATANGNGFGYYANVPGGTTTPNASDDGTGTTGSWIAGLKMVIPVATPARYFLPESRGPRAAGPTFFASRKYRRFIISTSDSPSGAVVLGGTRVEAAASAVGPSGAVVFAGTKSEGKGGSNTPIGALVLGGSKTDTFAWPPVIPTGVLVFGGSCNQSWGFNDTRSGALVLGGASSTNTGFSDIRSGALVFGGSRSEGNAGAVSRTGQLVLSGTRTEGKAYADARMGMLLFGGSRSESIVFCVSPGGTLSLGGGKTEAIAFAAAPSGQIVFGGSRSEAAVFRVMPSGQLLLGGSQLEGHAYHDIRTGQLLLSGLVTDNWGLHHFPTGTLLLLGSRGERRAGLDVPSGILLLGGSRTGSVRYVAAPVGGLILSGNRVERGGHQSSPLGTLLLSGIAHWWYTDVPWGRVWLTGGVVASECAVRRFHVALSDAGLYVVSLSDKSE